MRYAATMKTMTYTPMMLDPQERLQKAEGKPSSFFDLPSSFVNTPTVP
jgi:hypothetical protein